MNSYPTDTDVILTAQCRTPGEAGVLYDADKVTLTIRDMHKKTAATHTLGAGSRLVRLSEGTYQFVARPLSHGLRRYVWHFEGPTRNAKKKGAFDVEADFPDDV